MLKSDGRQENMRKEIDELIKSKDVDALVEEIQELRQELDAIHHAAHMPKDYPHNLPTWINTELYGKLHAIVSPDGLPARRSSDIRTIMALKADRERMYNAMWRFVERAYALLKSAETSLPPEGSAKLESVSQVDTGDLVSFVDAMEAARAILLSDVHAGTPITTDALKEAGYQELNWNGGKITEYWKSTARDGRFERRIGVWYWLPGGINGEVIVILDDIQLTLRHLHTIDEIEVLHSLLCNWKRSDLE